MDQQNVKPITSVKYSPVTSMKNALGTEQDLEHQYQEYVFSKGLSEDKDVLEIGCSIGRGLGLLSSVANSVVGLDINHDAIEVASAEYKDKKNIKVMLGDAHQLNFEDDSFDTILIIQTIYLMKDQKKVLQECRRVLRKGGKLLIATINTNRSDFVPCEYSTKYYTAVEFDKMLTELGFDTEFFVGVEEKEKVRYYLRVLASKLGIMPKSFKMKTLIKKVFYGKLKPVPNELYDNMTAYVAPKKVSLDQDISNFKVIYSVSELK